MENEKSEQKENPSCNIQIEEGFTEDDTGYQAVKWFFTYHIKKDNEQFEQAFNRLESLKDECKKYIWSEEYGKSGETPHIQGAFILHKKQRSTALAKFFKNGCTLRKLRSWDKAFEYCQKEQNRIFSNQKIQKPTEIISEEIFYKWQKKIIKIISEEPHKRNIYWFWGDQGVGKTQFQKYLVVKHEALILNGKPSDMKNGIIEYKKTNKILPELIVSNIGYDKNLSMVHYSGYEDIKDMCFYSGKYEGGMVCGNNPHLLIFANGPPETQNKKFVVERLTVG